MASAFWHIKFQITKLFVKYNKISLLEKENGMFENTVKLSHQIAKCLLRLILATWFKGDSPISPSPHWCILCVEVPLKPWTIYSRLFREAALSWGNPESCKELFCESYSFFGGNKRGVVRRDVLWWQSFGFVDGEG